MVVLKMVDSLKEGHRHSRDVTGVHTNGISGVSNLVDNHFGWDRVRKLPDARSIGTWVVIQPNELVEDSTSLAIHPKCLEHASAVHPLLAGPYTGHRVQVARRCVKVSGDPITGQDVPSLLDLLDAPMDADSLDVL